MNAEQTKKLKVLGVCLVVLGQGILSILGVLPSETGLLTRACTEYLLEHDEYTVIPPGCKEELNSLKRRIEDTLDDYNNNSSTMVTPESEQS